MMIKRKKRGFLLWILLADLLVLIWTGLSSGEVRTAVVPFEAVYGQVGQEVVRCLSCGNLFGSGPIEGNPTGTLTQLVWDKLKEEEKGFDFINPDRVEGYYNVLLSKGFEKDPLRLMKTLGLEVKADYIFWGNLFRYQERIGSSYSVQKPASVAFDLHLMRVKDGKLIWKAQWEYTQKPLSENLLELGRFAKSHWRWVTAEELFLQGLQDMLRNFPTADSLILTKE